MYKRWVFSYGGDNEDLNGLQCTKLTAAFHPGCFWRMKDLLLEFSRFEKGIAVLFTEKQPLAVIQQNHERNSFVPQLIWESEMQVIDFIYVAKLGRSLPSSSIVMP